MLSRQHLQFLQKLLSERNRLYETVQKTKEIYDKCCDQVELSRQKVERVPDLKSKEKLKRLIHQDILDMNNAKVRANAKRFIFFLGKHSRKKNSQLTEQLSLNP